MGVPIPDRVTTSPNVLTYVSDVGTCSARLPGGLGSILRAGGSREAGLPEQAIGFLSHGGHRVAYAVTGSGPLLLVDVGRAHHLEAFWRHRPYRDLVRRLSRRFTVVRWDRPGLGLSDRGRPDLSAAAEVALLERLTDALGTGEVAILAAGDAAPGMVEFAAAHPGAVSRMALYGTAAEGRRLTVSLPAATLGALASVEAPALHHVVAAAAAAGCEPEVGGWLGTALEASADVGTMAALVAASSWIDVRDAARRVQAPTLVLHREADAVVEPRWGRELAGCIPGATFASLPGAAHPIYAGDAGAVLDVATPFLAGEAAHEEAPLSPRELEVARLVMLGLTNAEIGRRLDIRRRTVDAHLEHIRSKLGVGSRARVAAWAVRNEPGAAVGRGA